MGLWWNVLIVAGLAGCATPVLWSGTAKDVEIADLTFRVRFTDTRAEATRISSGHVPERMVVLAHAKAAIEQASGCTVRPGTLYGDWSLVEAYLSCPGQPQGRVRPVLVHQPPVTPPAASQN